MMTLSTSPCTTTDCIHVTCTILSRYPYYLTPPLRSTGWTSTVVHVDSSTSRANPPTLSLSWTPMYISVTVHTSNNTTFMKFVRATGGVGIEIHLPTSLRIYSSSILLSSSSDSSRVGSECKSSPSFTDSLPSSRLRRLTSRSTCSETLTATTSSQR